MTKRSWEWQNLPMATTIKLHELSNASSGERKWVLASVEYLEHAINSDEFRQRVTQYRSKHRPGFRWNKSLANEAILAFVVTGAEQLSPERDYEWDLYLSVYSGRADVVGRTSPSSKVVEMNRNALHFRGPQDIPGICGNIAHEHCHKLGFDHPYQKRRWRKHTVPYAIGILVKDLVAKRVSHSSQVTVESALK
jgi:hypothetical protein